MTAPSRMSVAEYLAAEDVKPSAVVRPASAIATQALGRLKPGVMNKTEAAYAAHLADLKHSGEILWWAFESVTFKIADNCRYTPDFLVLLADARLEAHEVKGNWFTDDAKVKIKVAASNFPIRFVAVRKLPVRDGGDWSQEPF